MTDRPHPDLDAPLSEAEAAEMRRVQEDTDCCWLDPGDRMYCPGAAQCSCECHRQKRVTRREWEILKVQEFERLESENAALVAEVRRLRAATAELLAAIEAYDVGRYKTGREGRVGMLLRGFRETDARPNDLWWSDAVRVWKAVAALAGGTDTSDGR